jgi:hypothetical protein
MFNRYRKALLLLALLLPITAVADPQGVDPCQLNQVDLAKFNLDSHQLSNLTADCASKKLPANDTMSSVKAVAEHSSEISEAAKGIAEAIGIAAKELGIAVNDFLKSPAGTLTVALIIAKFFGTKIIGLLLLPFYAVILVNIHRRIMPKSYEFEHVPVLWGAFTRRKVKKLLATKWSDLPDSGVYLLCCVR